MNTGLIQLIETSIQKGFHRLGRVLIMALRLGSPGQEIHREQGHKEPALMPGGPYEVTRKKQQGDLLLWVPRRINSILIDALTGGYGYSHVTIDTGEVDLPTGKPVMAEITVGQTVERKFQDEYLQRAYARIPIQRAGVAAEAFVSCVQSKLGEPYDGWDALTLGEIQDPAKEVCSGLAADCLPEPVRQDIARAKRLGLLRRGSVSVHSPSGAKITRVFVSPNGFAQYYGAPEGRKLGAANVVVDPHPVDTSVKGVVRKHASKAPVLVWFSLVMILTLLMMKKERPPHGCCSPPSACRSS